MNEAYSKLGDAVSTSRENEDDNNNGDQSNILKGVFKTNTGDIHSPMNEAGLSELQGDNYYITILDFVMYIFDCAIVQVCSVACFVFADETEQSTDNAVSVSFLSEAGQYFWMKERTSKPMTDLVKLLEFTKPRMGEKRQYYVVKLRLRKRVLYYCSQAYFHR